MTNVDQGLLENSALCQMEDLIVISEIFWSIFSRVQTEYGKYSESLRIQSECRKNTDQNSSEYGHILRSERQNKNSLLIISTSILDKEV